MEGAYSLEAFPHNLRELMIKKEINTTKLAKTLQVCRMSIYNWRCGRADPTLRRIFELSGIFGVPITELLKEN